MVDTINELSDLAKKLNQKSDTLNDTIRTINDKLRKLNFGTEVWVDLDESDPYFSVDDEDERDPLCDETWLGYSKINDQWELATKDVTVGANGDVRRGGSIRPLLKSSREIRLEATKKIPFLLDAIKVKIESLLESIEKAERAAQQL